MCDLETNWNTRRVNNRKQLVQMQWQNVINLTVFNEFAG
jgi:hypothetical protein